MQGSSRAESLSELSEIEAVGRTLRHSTGSAVVLSDLLEV